MLLRVPRTPALSPQTLLADMADEIEAATSGGELTPPTDLPPLWEPLPGPQTWAWVTPADELYFGGAAGGGKTDLLLGLAVEQHHNSIIFRREYAQLRGAEGVIERSKQIIGEYGRLNESLNIWRDIRGGRSLEFGAVQREDDKNKWKGRPHDLKGFDELPEFSETQFRFLIGWLRTTKIGQRVRVVGSGNPPTTPEGMWVIRYWAPWLDERHPNPASPGELRWFAQIDGKDVEFPTSDSFEHRHRHTGTVEVIKPRSRTFIPARVEDNPYYMRTDYVDVLNALPEPLRSQLRYGSYTAESDDDPWQVIPTAWVRAAMSRWRADAGAQWPITSYGVDPSRGGTAQFVTAPRRGPWIGQLLKHEAREAPDGQAGAAIIYRDVNGDKSVPVQIDVIGTAGSSVYDQARDLGLKVIPLNGSEHSDATDKSGKLAFANKRAEWHWRVRESLEPGNDQDVMLPPDPQLLADLCAPRWKPTARGIQVEPKEQVVARIGRSPDCGEAVIYALAEEWQPKKKKWKGAVW